MNRDIAIIGISGRFPHAANLDELFETLRQGKDCVTEIPGLRIKETALPADRPFRKAGYLNDIDKFDHKFFGISMAEAKNMCPEQRILLETVYGAIENAGYDHMDLSGTNTAVFVSTANSSYYEHFTEYNPTLITGNAPEFLAAKIGRYFNLKGNATVIDTTCSSSLVAVHTACNEIIMGDADMAIVAGVHLLLFPFADEEGGLDTESPDGKSSAFSAKANGMSYGEVAGAILLKPLDAAIRDKDNIQAVLKGTAVNYNGNGSSSITAPDSRSQADVLLRAWKKAGIGATDLSFIEAHGSGTQLGDSLEFEAMNLAFAAYTDERHICPISTIKSNMGHGRNVSGLAGLLKTVLSLKHQVLFPTIHFEEPGPLLDYENSSVYVNREFCRWETKDKGRRYAGVSSLGWSGTNCHVVLAEGPADPAAEQIRTAGEGPAPTFHIPVSAKTPSALRENAAALLGYISRNQGLRMEDLSLTLTRGRSHYPFRLSLLVSSMDELIAALSRGPIDPAYSPAIQTGRLVYIFSDPVDLPDGLIDMFSERYAGFRTAWAECSQVMPLEGMALRSFAFQYAYYRLLSENNIVTDQWLPMGIGKIIVRVISQGSSLQEGLQMACDYKPEEITDKEGRVARLLEKLTRDGACTLLDMAGRGSLHAQLEKYRTMQDRVYYIGDPGRNKDRDPVLDIIHILYQRNPRETAYPWTHLRSGKKIGLPGYQFEKTRCWLRDEPKRSEKDPARTGAGEFALKEQAGYIQHKVAGIFAGILHVKELSVYDDFFTLGGDSLQATRAILEIGGFFDIELSFEDIFDFPTIILLADHVRRQLPTERKVILIWEAVLEQKDIRHEDDIFDLGAHSLMATQAIILLNKEFNTDLNFEDIFQNPTIGRLAVFIDSKKNGKKETGDDHSIQPAPSRTSYPLTYAQKRMLFLNEFVGGSSAYNNVVGICLDGDLSYELFDRALLQVVERHESLRTLFRMEEDEPRQFIAGRKNFVYSTEITDLTGIGEEETARLIDGLFDAEYNFVFDLAVLPIFRGRLIRTGERSHIYLLNIHHIISDGWSLEVFLGDFIKYYEQQLTGRPVPASPLRVQIKDYAEWQQGEEFRKILLQQENFWLDSFKDSVPILSLPADHQRPAVQSFEGDAVFFQLDMEQTDALKRIARNNDATLYMVLLAAYNILLAKLSNAEDIVVGTPIAGRRFDGLQSLIGLFMNTIACRNAPRPDLRFTEFLADLRKRTLGVFSHQDYPYEELVKKLLVQRDTSRNPVFDVMFILQNYKSAAEKFSSIKIRPYPAVVKTARVDLVMEVVETTDGLGVNMEFSTALFNKETILRFAAYFRNIVSAIIADVTIRLADIEWITPEEQRSVLYDFNDTRLDCQKDKTIPAIFEERAAQRGAATAVSFHGKALSYQDLDRKSSQVASAIRRKGIPHESAIGIMMPRSPEMLICMLGILKAGSAYLPIDPEYPIGRIKYMIADSGAGLVFVHSLVEGTMEDLSRDIELIDVRTLLAGGGKDDNPGWTFPPAYLAYLIYTSGSTGMPKGVMIEHRNVINFIEGMVEKIAIHAGNTILCLTTMSFDIFVLETILPLLVGAKIALADAHTQRDPDLLARLIRDEKVDILQITPSHLKLLLSAGDAHHILDGIRILMVGGEAFPNELLRVLKKNYKGRIYNMYGPTETTVWSTCRELTLDTAINIGKPIANTTIRILNANNRLQPPGIAGELFIGGDGVARGYWKRESLTAERFIADPYHEHARLYRTGDLARWLPDGNIEFLGRLDGQVKIRGLRIELGEIESQLRLYEMIKDAAVIAVEKKGEPFLAAYYVSEEEIPGAALRNFLAERLPYYMVPAYFIQLDSIPLTPNRKVDRKALPDPELQVGAGYRTPFSKTEWRLLEIWADILQADPGKIGIGDDFFSLGGHSVLAVRFIHTIRRVFQIHLTLRDFFENPSIERQARLIDTGPAGRVDRIRRVADRDHYPASSAQEGLYYEYMLNRQSLKYNIFGIYEIKGAPPTDRIRDCFHILINRHEGLRTGLSIRDGKIIQRIAENVDFEIAAPEAGRYTTLKDAVDDFIRPFDLAMPPLLRCARLQYGKSDLLLVDIHHIVCDGFSLNILMNEFKDIYRGRQLEPLPLRYVDYACREKEEGMDLQKQAAYWAHQLSGEWQRIDLSSVERREDDGQHPVSIRKMDLDEDLYAEIKKFAVERNVSEFMFLLSIAHILLAKMISQQDIVIGTDVVGRTQEGMQQVIGTFINVLPLRLQVDSQTGFARFLEEVRDTVLNAFDNQDLPFGEMQALVNRNNSRDKKRMIDVHFSFLNFLDRTADLAAADFAPFPTVDPTIYALYDLSIQAQDSDGKLNIAFVYDSILYDEDTIDIMMSYYHNILLAVLHNSRIALGDIELEGSMSYAGK